MPPASPSNRPCLGFVVTKQTHRGLHAADWLNCALTTLACWAVGGAGPRKHVASSETAAVAQRRRRRVHDDRRTTSTEDADHDPHHADPQSWDSADPHRSTARRSTYLGQRRRRTQTAIQKTPIRFSFIRSQTQRSQKLRPPGKGGFLSRIETAFRRRRSSADVPVFRARLAQSAGDVDGGLERRST